MSVVLEEKLKQYFGYNAFRQYQKEIIDAVMEKKDVLAILPTGAGKSLCYQLPAVILEGTAIVISPLISLMQDQVVSLFKNDIPAAFLNSSLYYQDIQNILSKLSDYKLLYVAPERFSDPQFLQRLKESNISFFVIDEAHCISQWGHAFRSEYRKLMILKENFPQCPVIALTATATQDVEKDILSQLKMKNPILVKGSFDRPNLTVSITTKANVNDQIFAFLKKQPQGSGIIYASTRKAVDQTYEELKFHGYSVQRYHAGLSDKDRSNAQHAFLHDQSSLMVATVAFGMGIHKPDVRFIMHINMPRSIEQYYQEIGRAGRDGLPAECLMIYSSQDIVLYKKFHGEVTDPVVIGQMNQKAEQMYRLCISNDCRRKEILKYFGERLALLNCKGCDNCLEDSQEIEGLEIAQKILSCVYRLRQNVGMRMLIDVLRGSKNQQVVSRNYHELSTHGLFSNISEQEIRFYIDSLLQMNVLMSTGGEYPVIKWTDQSRAVIDGQQPIYFKKRSFSKPAVEKKDAKQLLEQKEKVTLHYNQELFEQLRALRFSIANLENVPPYVIFSDRALQEMAVFYPQNQQEFTRINGVGPAKWIKYGEQFIEALKPYAKQKQEVKREPKEALQRSQSKDETIRLFQEGYSLEQIKEIRQLTVGTLVTHIAEAIEEGRDLDLTTLVSPEKKLMIQKVIEEIGFEKLTPIKERLPEDITYNEIRLVGAFYRRQ
ncbi:MAG: DNA helicase RecQ [Parachlamydiaceae bacterium]|nr:DNA helicase RecQ [Parachlamydiaceae bacterium]